ncbi:restriction endonuclease subunit S [Spirosoma spitsbergense]|uniref:restriction endonuclease subunit S n=1 Tax=Spirosoma spitsbergense TaxID=431554 RepID=UPI0003718589|nr:restriction endonuclease subunit S [Spirosoma spitsbergense]
MSTQQKKIPALRFSEFSDEWEEKRIGNILTIGSGKDYKHLEDGEIPVFGSGGLMTTVNDFLYDGETVCIGRKGTIDKPMYFSGKIWTVDTLFYTHSFKNTLPKFVYNLFLKINWKQHNEAGGVPSLSKSIIEKISLNLPSLPEQKKIASFLTDIDNKVALLTKKKALLEQYKKGIMQQLFSQQIRFKDDEGNEFPEWEEKRLGELYSFKSTNSYSREKLNYEVGEVKNIHYGDIHTKFKTLFNTAEEYVPYLNPDISVERVTDENYCKEGDMIFADASEDINDVGKSIEIVNLNGDKVLSGLHTILAGAFQNYLP